MHTQRGGAASQSPAPPSPVLRVSGLPAQAGGGQTPHHPAPRLPSHCGGGVTTLKLCTRFPASRPPASHPGPLPSRPRLPSRPWLPVPGSPAVPGHFPKALSGSPCLPSNPHRRGGGDNPEPPSSVELRTLPRGIWPALPHPASRGRGGGWVTECVGEAWQDSMAAPDSSSGPPQP